MAQKITVGIDLGTKDIKVAVVENVRQPDGTHLPRLLGTGSAPSAGLRHGYITHMADATRSIRLAVAAAEKSSGVKIKKAYLAVGGIGLSSLSGTGSLVLEKPGSEVTPRDVANAIAAAESELSAELLANRKIIFTIPLGFRLDDTPVSGRPAGMYGTKLEAKTLFIVCLDQHLADFIRAVEDAGVEVLDVLAAPIAASVALLSKNQKVAGSVLVTLGAETISTVVFENNMPIMLSVETGGGTDITNDLALAFRVPIDEAERAKHGQGDETRYAKKKIAEAAEKKLSAIFEKIDKELKKIGRSGLLPAGAILSGGTALIANIEAIAKKTLELPATVATITYGMPGKPNGKDAVWAVAYGLAVWGLHNDDTLEDAAPTGMKSVASISGIGNWFKRFLP